MSVRIPNSLNDEPNEIKLKTTSRSGNVQRIIYVMNGIAYTVWELLNSTFLDLFGNVFFDKNGTPFQGKQE